MDCGSSADGKEGTAFYELERGQLYAEPQVRPIYCHVTPLLWQEPPKEAARPAIAVGLLLWARRPGVIDRLLHVRRSAANAASHVADSADGDSQTSRRYLRMHGRLHLGENGVS